VEDRIRLDQKKRDKERVHTIGKGDGEANMGIVLSWGSRDPLFELTTSWLKRNGQFRGGEVHQSLR